MNPLIFPAVSYGCLKFPMVGPLVGCTFHFWLHVVSKLRRKMYTRSMTRSPIIGITRPSSKRRVFFGGGMGWGAQNWSMINVTLATPVPALGSLCFNDSSKSWCGGVESILRNLWDVDRGDRLDAIGLWKSEGSEIGLPCVWSMVSRVSDTELHPAVRIGFLEFLTPAAQLKRISSQSCFFCLEIIRDTSLWFPRVRFSRNEHSCGSTYLNKSTIPLLLLHSTGFPSLFNHWMIYFTVQEVK